MDVHPTLGQALRRHREGQGLSLRDIEDRTGVLVQVLGKIERGETRSPGILTVAKICKALGISVDQVLREAGALPPLSVPRPSTVEDIKQVLGVLELVREDVRGLRRRK